MKFSFFHRFVLKGIGGKPIMWHYTSRNRRDTIYQTNILENLPKTKRKGFDFVN